jgi:hypothetical protein
MDATDLEARVRADRETELSRLSSSKALYAATGGEMDREAVVRAAADRAAAAHECYRAWADDGPGADRFEEVAAAEADRLATVEALRATPTGGPGSTTAWRSSRRQPSGRGDCSARRS